MPRRVFWPGLLAVAVLLSWSLSAAAGVAVPSAISTPTVGPLTDPAYMPLVARAPSPSPTSTSVPPTPTATSTATATATVEPNCLDYHYPITFNKIYLEDLAPYAWYKPVTLASIGLSPLAENEQIPSLNTTNPNSPRFRVYSRVDGSVGSWSFTRWNGASGTGSASELEASLTGRGNLAAGFSEMTPPPSDPAALIRMNGILEIGDWLPSESGVYSLSGIPPLLDYHIANKTQMVLPVHDLINGSGASPGSGYRATRFITVRLLNYSFSSNPWFEFALVQDNSGCASLPPTPTATATQPVPGNPLTLDLTERLQWTATTTGTGYDIVIVLDMSYSMSYCWDTNNACVTGSRRIDYAAAAIRGFVNEMLVRRYDQGARHRLALVTFNQNAIKAIPFNSDRTASLYAFRDFFGDVSSPKTIPNSMLAGNTNTAAGLVAANEYLANARTVDTNGQPVRTATLLFNDGLANVFNDGPAANVTNSYRNAPYYCGRNSNDVDNPLVQASCPRQADYPGQVISTPPLKAMVAAADAGRAARPTQFYAVVVGAQFGLTPQSMHLTEVAPGRAYMANNPFQLEGLVTAIEEELAQSCTEYAGGSTPAAGASVAIRDQAGTLIGGFTTDPQGRLVVPSLPPGTYTLSAAHLDVIAPADPSQQPRDYTRMVVPAGSAGAERSLTFVMPDAAHTLPDIRLLIDNAINAQCP